MKRTKFYLGNLDHRMLQDVNGMMLLMNLARIVSFFLRVALGVLLNK